MNMKPQQDSLKQLTQSNLLYIVKEYIISSATEVASMILRIDDVITATGSKDMSSGPDLTANDLT